MRSVKRLFLSKLSLVRRRDFWYSGTAIDTMMVARAFRRRRLADRLRTVR